MDTLFERAGERAQALPLSSEGPEVLVFDFVLTGSRRIAWRSLFEGFETLKVVTFSASVPAILDVARLFDDVEITFGSERILLRELAALEQATSAAGYGFVDSFADQKAFIERFVRPALSKGGRQLLERVHAGTLRFRLLRQAPSHAKLFLMAGAHGSRVVTGSANFSLAALTGRQRETLLVSDAEADYERFMDYYAENEASSDLIAADLLVVRADDADGPGFATPDAPLEPRDVPCLRFVQAQGVVKETARPPDVPQLSSAALRQASEIGAELRQLALDRDRSGATVVTADGFARAYRAHAARPITERTDHVRRARIDLEGGLITLDGRPWHRLGAPVPWPEVERDAALLAPYFEGFERFYGDVEGVRRSYWALTCWLYAAPFSPILRSAAVRHDGSTLAYPVHAVLYGRSDGGKTIFSRVISRSMFGVEQMIRGQHFTTARALGLRDQLGAIPLLIDDVNRDRFSQYAPDLVKHDHETGESYAPLLISTNRDVTAITPDLRKRMIVCHIDGARPRSVSEAPARAALAGIGTALYRAYLERFVPCVPDLLEEVAADPQDPPDLIETSARVLGGLITEALGAAPAWVEPISLDTIDRLKDKPFLDVIQNVFEQNAERVSINRDAGELIVQYGGDHHQAARFEKLVPPQALKGRFADAVKLDLVALEREYGFTPGARRPRSWLARLLGR